VNVFRNVCADSLVQSFIAHIEVVRRLHIRKLANIAVAEPWNIVVLAPAGILALVPFDTSAVAVACILAWVFVGRLDEVLGDIPAWEHFDRTDVVPFGILVLEFDYKPVRVLVHKLLFVLCGIRYAVLVCTLL
jgi:hypothetical protein